MSGLEFNAVIAILLIPLAAAGFLAVLPGYRSTARLNVTAAFLTLIAALSLFVTERPTPGSYFLVDDLNIVFVALNTFIGFTASLFHSWHRP